VKISDLNRLIINFANGHLDKFRVIFEILIILAKVLIITFYMACLWCWIGEYCSLNFSDSWILNNKLSYNKFLYSFYYCFQILVLDGNILIQTSNELEVIISFLFKLIAILNAFYVIIKVAFLFVDVYRKDHIDRENFKILNDFMRKNKISPMTKAKIMNFWENSLKSKKNTIKVEKHQEVQAQLPEAIRNQVLLEFPDRVKLIKMPIFAKNFTEASLKKLPGFLSEHRFCQGENIFSSGEIDKSLYFFIKGKARICLPFKDDQYNIKGPNDIIGLESFFGNQPRAFTFKALTKKVKVLKLSQEDFLNVLKEKPEDHDKFCEIRDKIQFEENFEDLNVFCKICFSKRHYEINCPLIFRNFNRKFQIQKLSLRLDFNRRTICFFRKKEKRNFAVFNKKKEKEGPKSSQFKFSDEISEEEMHLMSSTFENLEGKSLEIDQINWRFKENYFPHNHHETIIEEYNENIGKNNKRNENFIPWNGSKISFLR